MKRATMTDEQLARQQIELRVHHATLLQQTERWKQSLAVEISQARGVIRAIICVCDLQRHQQFANRENDIRHLIEGDENPVAATGELEMGEAQQKMLKMNVEESEAVLEILVLSAHTIEGNRTQAAQRLRRQL